MLRGIGATTSAGKTGCSLVRGAARPPAHGSSPPCQVSHLQQGATLVPRNTKLTIRISAAMFVLRALVMGKPGEPLLVHASVPQLLVHDGVDVGGGGVLLLEQGWSQLRLNLQGENW